MGSWMNDQDLKFLILFILAIANDAIDILGLFNPIAEVFLDLSVVVMINLLLGFNVWSFIITFIDIIPGIDLAPIWTLYILKLYLQKGGKKSYTVKVE